MTNRWDAFHPCKEISIEVTNECCLKCAHCSSKGGKPFEKELTIDEIKDIINCGVEKLATEVISLSGGEPLLKPKLYNVIDHVNDKGLKILLYTCGNYPGQDGKLYSAANLDKLEDRVQENLGSLFATPPENLKAIFSMEGLELTHDGLTKHEGSFDNVCESIKMFRDFCDCEVHLTPNRINYKFMPDVYKTCVDLGVKKLSLLRMVPQGRCDGFVHELVPTKDEMKEILWLVHRMKVAADRDNCDTKLRIGDPLNWEFFFDNRVVRRCCAGIDRILIRANGEVQFCAALKHAPQYDFGNVFNNSLDDMWNNSDMAKFLRKIHYGDVQVKGKCMTCEFYGNCHGGCTSQRIARYGDALQGPDPLCVKAEFGY